MQFRKILLTGISCALFFNGYAQEFNMIRGTVNDETGKPISGVSLKIQNSAIGAITNTEGVYQLEKIKSGSYVLMVSSIGYAATKKEVTLKNGQVLQLNFKLNASVHTMETVTVLGQTETQKVNKQAYNVTAVDAKKLYNTTLDLSHALDRVSGVRVRETGGVGSRFDFSLNGFTGRQVKFFLDGVPMDNFGSSFQLNNIPINVAERIEVYKGVVPISLGADALGGAVNIVTNASQRNYLDASYSYGSFNTHRSTLSAGFTDKSGFTVQLNAFQNYSDNDYRVYTKIVPDLKTGATYLGWANRFNDTYRNETMIANVGIVNKKYADRLLFGVTLGQNEAGIQTGNRMEDVYGKRRRRGNIVMPSLKYSKKDLFVKGLTLSVNGNFNLGEEQTIDTAFRQYNWLGKFLPKDPDNPGKVGGERSRTLYKYKNNNGILNGNLSYQLSEQHSFVLNSMFSTFNRKGSDELIPDDENLKQPRKTQKSIIGLGYRFDAGEKWNATLFVKEYSQHNTSSEIYNKVFIVQENKSNHTGYGLATTYFVRPDLQLKASYEKSFRLPDNEELFGDVGNIDPNFSLRPEHSHNLNFGGNYVAVVNRVHQITLDGNVIYRIAKDYIRQVLNTSSGKGESRSDNTRNVNNLGFDGEVRYSYKNLLTAGMNVTYQNLRNTTKFEPNATVVSDIYKDRIPNIPYLFGNANASLFFKNVGRPANTLSVGYNLLYVHNYYLRWPGQGDATTKTDIPTQFSHDANVVYAMSNGKYNLAFECRNLTDALLYDNFSLQKPGRSFNLKLRYFISNKH